MEEPQEINGEDIAALAELFDLLARFQAEDIADGSGQAKPANPSLDAKLNRGQG